MMSSTKLDCNSMSAMVSTPQCTQSYNSVSHNANPTRPLQRSHRLEAGATSHVRSSERQNFPLDNQIINIDAATIHAWRHNVGQNQQDGSQQVLLKLSPPASPSYKQNSTFNSSASCTVTTKSSSDFCSKLSKSASISQSALPPRAQRATLARGDSEISKQCGGSVTKSCDAVGLEAKRQKDLIVTEKMIGKWLLVNQVSSTSTLVAVANAHVNSSRPLLIVIMSLLSLIHQWPTTSSSTSQIVSTTYSALPGHRLAFSTHQSRNTQARKSRKWLATCKCPTPLLVSRL